MTREFSILDFAQHLDDGSANPQWIAARLGRITGTGANGMLAKPKVAGEGMRANLVVQLALERLTGQKSGKDFQSEAMEEGLRLEPECIFAYEKHTGQLVNRVGFLSHDTLMAGASIDGYVDDFVGLVSAKCPYSVTHWDLIRTGQIRLAWMRQIVHEQWLTGAQWTDLVSFNPSFSESLRLHIVRVPRNDDAIAQHDHAVRSFLQEVDAAFNSMRVMSGGIGAVA